MTKYIRSLTVFVSFALAPAAAAFAQHSTMPPGMTHQEHQAQLQKEAELKRRGAAAMGFDQGRTTHHFRLLADGGAIEVAANDTSDAASRDQIRAHMKEIAKEFANGDFAKPFATHGEAPPGVKSMQERKTNLRFTYEETAAGGRVRISTTDATARNAVHEFLRYQIREHSTGDSLEVGGPPRPFRPAPGTRRV
jgi:hypothetical protein